MIITLTQAEFIDRFLQIRPNNFSTEGLRSLYEYFEEVDEGMEFDPIAICTEYTEYSSLRELLDEYGGDFNYIKDIQDLSDYTSVIPIDDFSFIIADF